MSVATMDAQSIHQLRQDLGWTQQRLADELGVNRTTVTVWELGINQPSGPSQILLDQLRSRAERLAKKKSSSRG